MVDMNKLTPSHSLISTRAPWHMHDARVHARAPPPRHTHTDFLIKLNYPWVWESVCTCVSMPVCIHIDVRDH